MDNGTLRLFSVVIVLACGLSRQSFAQEEKINLDSLLKSEIDAALIFDSLDLSIGAAEIPELEYVPSTDTPELVADRLDCIEQSIPLTYNDKIHAFINYFTIKDREYTKMILRRKDLYFPIFEKYLAQYGLPDELKYLSIVESGLNPRAVSRVRAVGLWQFMSPTGRYFGLHNDWYVDDRMDPEKSTEAACKYLSQLYNMFNDWELALAAYNSGPGNVRKAIRRSGYKKNFWEIYRYLPRETRAYVPQFVAIMYTLNYTQNLNFYETSDLPLVAHDTLMVNHYLHFETFANLTGASMDDLLKLNPSVLRKAIPGTGRQYIIRVPLAAKENLLLQRAAILDSASRVGKDELEALAKNTLGSTYGRELVTHQVRSGDVLGKIAERYHVRVGDIKNWNNLNSNVIRIGQRLKIWVLPSDREYRSTVASNQSPAKAQIHLLPPGTKFYTVEPGDTLWDISRKFEGLTIEKLKTLNNLKSTKLQPGQKLIIG
ncbi:MAG: LysM peptidoglycan-binding domain-containing protein [Cyclobacteriaceae bacterium]